MTENVINTSRLTRRYGKSIAVQNLDLQVPHGCVYGFLGPNGAGKTTTIRMLLGLLRPDQGTVKLFGQPMRRNNVKVLQRVGSLVENPSLYPQLTGHENMQVLSLMLNADPRRIDYLLQMFRISKDRSKLVRKYSTGMKQRLGLAMAMLCDPELLILDEPTNGLDPAGIQEIRDLIRRLPEQEGTTVFLSTHLLQEVEYIADQIGIINNGELCFQGSLDELIQRMDERLYIKVDQTDRARDLLHQAGWHVSQHNGHLILGVNGPADAARVNACLTDQKIAVYEIQIRKSSLEELFIQFTNPSETC